MYIPCNECVNRRGFSYTKDCDDTCSYASAVKCRDKRIKELEFFDRLTALRVLQDLSSCMYPSYDLFGTKTLVINRDKFEKIRDKYLDRKEEY